MGFFSFTKRKLVIFGILAVLAFLFSSWAFDCVGISCPLWSSLNNFFNFSFWILGLSAKINYALLLTITLIIEILWLYLLACFIDLLFRRRKK